MEGRGLATRTMAETGRRRWRTHRAAQCSPLLLVALSSACGGLAADGDVAVDAEPMTELDRTLEKMATDLLAQPASDRRHLRYLVVAAHDGGASRFVGGPPRTEAELIGRAMDRDRVAASKLINSLTVAPTLRVPEPIDAERTILRIDLRDYGWGGPVDVAGTPHADLWQAIAANAAFALPLEGPHAAQLEELTGSPTSFLFARDFVATAAQADLYYAALPLPASLDELLAQLVRGTFVGATQRVSESGRFRAGFTTSAISPVIRAVERGVDESDSSRGYWQAFDFGNDERGSSVFSDPLAFAPDGTEVIFTLPNGLHAFFMADADGQRVTEYPPASVTEHGSRDRLYGSAECFGCHSGGALEFSDQVRSRYIFEQAEVPPNVQARILATYPDGAVMNELLAGANQAYVRTLEQVGQAPGEPDDVSAIAAEPKTASPPLDLAASHLFVSPEELASAAGIQVDNGFVFAEYGAGSAGAPTFREAYPDLLCELQRAGLNKPAGCR
jgi:hypothetical protein